MNEQAPWLRIVAYREFYDYPRQAARIHVYAALGMITRSSGSCGARLSDRELAREIRDFEPPPECTPIPLPRAAKPPKVLLDQAPDAFLIRADEPEQYWFGAAT